MEAEKFFSTKEAAAFLGVSDRTIQNYRKDGILVPDQFGKNNSVFYSKKQLVEVVKSLLTSGEKLLKFRPQVVKSYQQVVTRSEVAKEDLEPEKERKSIRLIPAKMLVMTNDKLTKELFRCTPEEYHALFEEGGEIVEVKNFPKVGEIITPYWLELIDEYTDKTPLTMFAKAILTACVSEWVIGNRHITVGVIFRHITGKPSGSNAQPSPAMKELILFFIRKMMCTILRVDMTDVCKYLNYNNGAPLILNAPILPCKYVEGVTINGNESEDVIYFYDESPLLTIARVKNNQLLSVEPRLLSISNRSGSQRSISVRHCIIQRVLESFLHNMEPIIAFDYVFKVCGFMNADSRKKCKVIHGVIDIFEDLMSNGDITSFTVRKDGDKYQAIEFTFSQVVKSSISSGEKLYPSGEKLAK